MAHAISVADFPGEVLEVVENLERFLDECVGVFQTGALHPAAHTRGCRKRGMISGLSLSLAWQGARGVNANRRFGTVDLGWEHDWISYQNIRDAHAHAHR